MIWIELYYFWRCWWMCLLHNFVIQRTFIWKISTWFCHLWYVLHFYYHVFYVYLNTYGRFTQGPGGLPRKTHRKFLAIKFSCKGILKQTDQGNSELLLVSSPPPPTLILYQHLCYKQLILYIISQHKRVLDSQILLLSNIRGRVLLQGGSEIFIRL